MRSNILQAIGDTSIVPLRKVVPARCARILAKLEWENPTGSLKDRMAQAVIDRAEARGQIKPGTPSLNTQGVARGRHSHLCVLPGDITFTS